MADNSFKITASLDIPSSVSKIEDDIKKIQNQINGNDKNIIQIKAKLADNAVANIQSQLLEVTNKNYTINIGASVSNIQSQMSQVQNKIISDIDITKKETDVLINEMIAKMQSLGTVDLSTFISNLKNSIGAGSKDVKNAAIDLYNALKLSPENQTAIADSYT